MAPISAAPRGDPGDITSTPSRTFLDGSEQVPLDVVVPLVADRDDGTVADLVGDRHTVDDLRVLDEASQVDDATLHLALLLLGGVVVAVLLEVTELARRFDLAGDVDPPVGREVLVLGEEPVVRLLGQLGGPSHGHGS